jgi:isoprenylcysteine carboxyl methyltransferase (ICMT) family protein YpbQ
MHSYCADSSLDCRKQEFTSICHCSSAVFFLHSINLRINLVGNLSVAWNCYVLVLSQATGNISGSTAQRLDLRMFRNV